MTPYNTPPVSNPTLRFPNGISSSTGRPLEDDFQVAAPDDEFADEIVATGEEGIARAKSAQAKAKWGLIEGVDGSQLSQAGWGLIFPAAAPAARVKAILDALSPLITHREKEIQQQDHSDGAVSVVKIFRDREGYQKGETSIEWLARQRVSMSPVDPRMGVPYYLLLIGSPDEIPYEFQYTLDIYWGVGRLYFDAPAHYRRYAENIVRYETANSLRTERTAAIFATRHTFDDATKLFHDEVALPLANGDQSHKSLGIEEGFSVRPILADSATRSALIDLMAGTHKGTCPALLFTGSHGLAVDAHDARQRDLQGALICQDWKTLGSIGPRDWTSAADVPESADVLGLIHFSFACYSAGTPQLDDYHWQHRKNQRRISSEAFVAKLPQKLLLKGALAACGHVDRAWAHSFYAGAAGAQIQGFRDVLRSILRGKRVGMAMDQFNTKWAALSVQLAEVLEEMRNRKKVPAQYLADLWIARNDARNYIVLGDPAVRLRVELLQNLTTTAGKN